MIRRSLNVLAVVLLITLVPYLTGLLIDPKKEGILLTWALGILCASAVIIVVISIAFTIWNIYHYIKYG